MYVDVAVPLPLDSLFTYSVPPHMEVSIGQRVRVPFGKRSLVAYPVNLHNTPPVSFQCKDITEVIDEEPLFDERTIDLAGFTSQTYLSSLGEAFSAALPSGVSAVSRYKLPFASERVPLPELTELQQSVVDEINGSTSKLHLIHGITGSGKTEVYIHLARKAMDEGTSVLFLVPEISLSSQLFQRLHRVFGSDMVIYHSQLTKNQRLKHWKDFYTGSVPLAIGTRSSVFMQCPRLGLIIIDEEHDSSYKEHSTPRYNARRIALYRSKHEGCTVVMGSATPAVETMFAAQKGIIEKHELLKRYGKALLPEIDVVELESTRDDELITSRLKLHVSRALRENRQVIFFLNRRGFSPMVICNSCSHTMECPHCSISMNYHKEGTLVCHYCGYTVVKPEVCPQCGSKELVTVGSGTQKVEGLLDAAFPGKNIVRVDQDSVRKKDAMYHLVEKMEAGEIDILLGTQMISKGFDFPGVTVVGVLMADIGMNLPDFRASERAFSLLMQVAGRSGRGEERGKVVVQTLDKEKSFFDYLIHHDYISFYHEELAARKVLAYPPFTRLVRLLVRGNHEEKVAAAAEAAAREARKVQEEQSFNLTVMGPAMAPLMKIANQYRYHVILKSGDLESALVVARQVKSLPLDQSLYLEIDVDPYDLL